MKVLITVPRLDMPGGVSNYYRTLRRLLDDQKVYFEVGAIPEESSAVQKMGRLMQDYWRFARLLRQSSFDLVHINPSMDLGSILRDAVFLVLAKLRRKPVLVFYRGWMPHAEAAVRGRLAGFFRLVFARSQANIVLAKEFRDKLVELGIPGPYFIETTVVDDRIFEAGYSIERRRPAIESCEVLFLGRLDFGKGLPEAIAAFACLQRHCPQARLRVVGDGPARRHAEAEVALLRLSGVTFEGHLTGAAKDAAFRGADIYLFTSLAEGMPNSVLEAMAFGLPIVTRAIGGIRDFFEDGRMGYSSESRDPEVYGQLLCRLASDPQSRHEIGLYNYEFARRQFAASMVAERLNGIYRKVCSAARCTSGAAQ